MPKPSRRRLEFAAAGFLAEMRKQFVALHPDKECPIGTLADYPPMQRSVLMAGAEKMAHFLSPETDRVFETWVARQDAAPSDDQNFQ